MIRQMFEQKRNGESKEITVATSTTPILAGTVAGLLAPKKWRVPAALVVSLNAGANLTSDPMDPVIQGWIDRQRASNEAT